jgi:hypothetical protein
MPRFKVFLIINGTVYKEHVFDVYRVLVPIHKWRRLRQRFLVQRFGLETPVI